MPLIKLEHLPHAAIAVWEVTESDAFFLEKTSSAYRVGYEPQRFSARRKREFLASRYLLWQLMQDNTATLTLDESGKLKDARGELHFSLSHSGNRVAAIVSATHVVGIDVEEIHPRILKVMHKFLNEQERHALGAQPELWRITLCWSAKESIFKMAETPGLSFSKAMQLHLPDSEKGSFKAMVNMRSGWENVEILFEKSGDYILTSCGREAKQKS